MKEYLSLNEYLKKTFGCKVYKIALDAGFTCPNRDGSVGRGGCIFCSGSGEGVGLDCLQTGRKVDFGFLVRGTQIMDCETSA